MITATQTWMGTVCPMVAPVGMGSWEEDKAEVERRCTATIPTPLWKDLKPSLLQRAFEFLLQQFPECEEEIKTRWSPLEIFETYLSL